MLDVFQTQEPESLQSSRSLIPIQDFSVALGSFVQLLGRPTGQHGAKTFSGLSTWCLNSSSLVL